MQALLALSRLIDALNRMVGALVAWLVVIMVLISAGNATSRKLFDMSSNAWLELQWYLYAAVFLLASGYTLLKNDHVRIDVLFGRLSERTQVKVEIAGLVFCLLPMAIIIWTLAWPYFFQAWQTQEVSMNAGGLIRWPVKLLIPLGFSLLILAGVSHLIKCVGFLKGLCANPLLKEQMKAEQELAQAITAATAAQGSNTK
jgi:TRAP-type mannitol/chloroaromatic compound transport system permease small subunit